MNGLDRLPYADTADPDPSALPFDAPRVEVRTMNRGRSDEFDRAYLYCPNGHETVSTPVNGRLGLRLLAGDYSGEWCGHGGCRWEG